MEYFPFGEVFIEQNGSYNTPYKYNGKELDSETGLYYYGARYYNPELSLWLSVDPKADHPKVIGHSPYTYVLNNPVKYIDPDGQLPIIPIIAGIWALAELGMSAYDAYDTGKTILDPDKTAGEKWLAGGLFMAGVVFPGGGYSQLDNLGKWGIKSTKAVQRVNQRAQKATNMLFGKNKDINISLGGVSSKAEANAIGETIVGKLTYNAKKGWNEGTKVINNKQGEFKIHFRGPADKKYDTGGNMVSNLQMWKSSISETGKKIWTEVKNVHIEVQ